MATQTYTASGAITVPTTVPAEAGQSVLLGSSTTPIGYNEFNYLVSKNGGVAVGSQGADSASQMYAELTDLIAKWCQATTTGLSTGTAALPYASVTPREVLTRLQFMISSMLTQYPA